MLDKLTASFCIALLLSGCSQSEQGYKFCNLKSWNEPIVIDITSSKLFASDVVMPIEIVSSPQFVGLLEPFPISLPRSLPEKGSIGRSWEMGNYRFSEKIQHNTSGGTVLSAFSKVAPSNPETVVYLSKTGDIRKIIVDNDTGSYTLQSCGRHLNAFSFNIGR